MTWQAPDARTEAGSGAFGGVGVPYLGLRRPGHQRPVAGRGSAPGTSRSNRFVDPHPAPPPVSVTSVCSCSNNLLEQEATEENGEIASVSGLSTPDSVGRGHQRPVAGRGSAPRTSRSNRFVDPHPAPAPVSVISVALCGIPHNQTEETEAASRGLNFVSRP